MDPINALKAVVMGVVEGLTEFLPISSTGHLIATAELIGFYMTPEEQQFRHLFEIVIQLGAILAVIALFRQRVWRVVSTLHNDASSREFVLKLSAAFIPAGIVGYTMHKIVEEYLMNTGVVAAMLALGGIVIIVLERRKEQKVIYEDAMALPWKVAIGIGCFQCLSILLPGASRAAASILGGIVLGLHRRAATEFSFFLAIPTMLAATTYSLLKHRDSIQGEGLGIIAIGFIVSFIVAWIVIAWLIKFVSSNTFTVFGWYRIIAGFILAILIVSGVISLEGS